MGGFVISGVRIQNPESRIQNKIFLPLKWAVYYFVLGWRV